MDAKSWLLTLLLIIPFLPLFFRQCAIRRASNRFERAAAGLWLAAVKEGATQDDQVRRMHDSFLLLAMVSPHIGGGRLILPIHGRIRKSAKKTVSSPIDPFAALPWAMPYISTVNYQLFVLAFFGTPYDVRLWYKAPIAAAFLRAEKDGATDIGPFLDRAENAVSRVDVARDHINRRGFGSSFGCQH
jgi:hypothetical protein